MVWVMLAGLIVIGGYVLLRRISRQKRLDYIENYRFPGVIKSKLRNKHGHLDESQLDLVEQGLRDYLYICCKAGKRMVAMPSQVVDDAWHEFILYTRCYELFCRKAMGRFLHHTPTEAMSSKVSAQDGIKRAWRLSCEREKINPKTPSRLPLLFELDHRLDIENGYIYSLNCQDKSSPLYGDSYCAGHIGCASGCGGDSGSTSDCGGSGCSSSCGSGCGGD